MLRRLFAAPDARGRGIGLRLTKMMAMAYARQRPAFLALDVMDKDLDAIHLYKGLGWTPIGTGFHPYSDTQEIAATAYLAPAAEAPPKGRLA